MNVASGDGFCIVGQQEYQVQSAKHGGRQMNKLAKQIARVMVLLGLESGLSGVAAINVGMVDDDAFPHAPACFVEPNTDVMQGGDPLPGFVKLLICFGLLCLVVFLWRTYKMARDAFASYERNYTDLAVVESYIEQSGRENAQLKADVTASQEQMRREQTAYNELEGQQEMLSDQFDGLHYGVVMLGGYTNHSELTPAQRQHVFAVEPDPLVTSGERGESEDPVFDPVVPLAEPVSNLTQTHETLRDGDELNACLSREAWSDAAEIQNMIMILPEALNGAQPMDRGVRIRLFTRFCEKMERLADVKRQQGDMLIAQRYQEYADQLRDMAWID
eukprot:s57_g74.t1